MSWKKRIRNTGYTFIIAWEWFTEDERRELLRVMQYVHPLGDRLHMGVLPLLRLVDIYNELLRSEGYPSKGIQTMRFTHNPAGGRWFAYPLPSTLHNFRRKIIMAVVNAEKGGRNVPTGSRHYSGYKTYKRKNAAYFE